MRRINHSSRFIEMFGTLDSPKVPVKRMIEVSKASGQYGLNASAVNYIEGRPRYIRITDICDDGSLNDDIKCSDIDDSTYSVNKGDVLFARTGATVGKTYLHRSGDACFAGYLIRYSFTEAVDPEYILAYTHSDTYYDWVLKSQKVGAQPNISASQYDNMPILIPGRKEQEAFLCLYRQADKSKFSDFKSRFIEMFGGIKKNQWPLIPFSSFATIDAQMTTDFIRFADCPHIGIDSIEQNTGQLLVYRTVAEDNVKSGKYIFTRNHIIYSKIRPNLNKVAEPSFDGLCSADSYPILARESICRKHFLAILLRSDEFLSYIIPLSNRTGMPKVNREQLEGFSYNMPPIALQDQFLSIAEQADKSKFELKQAIEKIDKVMRALQQ